MIRKGKKIVVGLSGGVDSSVALILLKKQGWQPVGLSLKLPVWPSKKNLFRENICCTRESFAKAKSVCQKLGIPYSIIDVSPAFKKKVIDYFISEFKKAHTPNPCIICNRYLRFIKFFEWAKKHKIKYVATGHYARLRRENPKSKTPKENLRFPTGQVQNPKYQLSQAKDKEKDQTYFLSFLPQKWLSHIIFPLGDYTKKEVYQIAEKEGFDFFEEKSQSQDFCYVAGKSLAGFLEEKVGRKPGKIVDLKGRVLGGHQGLHFYTIGQRKGLNLTGGPYFVKDFDAKKSLLIVTKSPKEVAQKEVILKPFHFISGDQLKKKIQVMAKTRYRQPLAGATLYPPQNGKLKIIFEKPQFAVTPGQFSVFYQNKSCLGAGVIN